MILRPSNSTSCPLRILQRLRNSTLPLTVTWPSEITMFAMPQLSQRFMIFKRLFNSIKSLCSSLNFSIAYPQLKSLPHLLPFEVECGAYSFFNEYHPAKIPRIPTGKVAMPEIIDKYEPVLVLLIIKKIPPVTDITTSSWLSSKASR